MSGGRNRRRHYYEDLRRAGEELHPVDVAVEARLSHRVVRRRIRHLQDRIVATLGSDPKAFLQLEELWHDEAREREEAYFNVGYEYGANAVRHRLREIARGVSADKLEAASARVRDELARVGLTTSETLLVLVESLWVLAVRGSEAKPD